MTGTLKIRPGRVPLSQMNDRETARFLSSQEVLGLNLGDKLSWDASTNTLVIDGSVTADAGVIGGWALGATALTAGSGATTVGLDSGGTNPALYAGSATPASAPFRVTQAGALTATSATITGTINLANTVQTFTPTWAGGFASDPSGDISYIDFGAEVRMFRASILVGVSNGTQCTFSGIPSAIRPSSGTRIVPCMIVNTSATFTGSIEIDSSGVATLYMGTVTAVGAAEGLIIDGAGFIASGNKGLPAGWSIQYPK